MFVFLFTENADEGNYQCLLCNRRTINGTTMKRHISSHFNYRRYGCPYCELLFTQSTFVLNHVRSKHHNKRLYYVDQKIPEVEEKIRDSWVNIKELEAKDKSGAVAVLPAAVDGSKLKALLTQPNTSRAGALGRRQQQLAAGRQLQQQETEADAADAAEGAAAYQNGDVEQLDASDDDVDDAENNDADASQTNNNHMSLDDHDLDHSDTRVTSRAQQQHAARVQYKCVRCDYSTQHRTSMSRHLMWKIGYKPYACAHCGASEITASGVRKHCSRRHRGQSQTPLLCKSAEKEYELEQLIQQSMCNPPPQQQQQQLQAVKRQLPAAGQGNDTAALSCCWQSRC